MGYQVIKQPDGKLTIFSSYVDAWAEKDLSAGEAVQFFVDIEAERTRRSAQAAVDHVVAGEPRKAYYQFAMTYEDAEKWDAWAAGNGPHPLSED